MATILPFPNDEMAAPPAVTNRELARLLIEECQRKREHPEPPEGFSLTTTRDLQSNVLMAELSPKLLNDSERAASDSTNGKMTRLLNGECAVGTEKV